MPPNPHRSLTSKTVEDKTSIIQALQYFSRHWSGQIETWRKKGTGKSAERKYGSQFWLDLLHCFGYDNALRLDLFEYEARRADTGGAGRIDVFIPGVLIGEIKSLHVSLSKADSQIRDYLWGGSITQSDYPAGAISTNFEYFHIWEPGNRSQLVKFHISEIHHHFDALVFLLGHNAVASQSGIKKAEPIKPATKLALLFRELERKPATELALLFRELERKRTEGVKNQEPPSPIEDGGAISSVEEVTSHKENSEAPLGEEHQKELKKEEKGGKHQRTEREAKQQRELAKKRRKEHKETEKRADSNRANERISPSGATKKPGCWPIVVFFVIATIVAVFFIPDSDGVPRGKTEFPTVVTETSITLSTTAAPLHISE